MYPDIDAIIAYLFVGKEGIMGKKGKKKGLNGIHLGTRKYRVIPELLLVVYMSSLSLSISHNRKYHMHTHLCKHEIFLVGGKFYSNYKHVIVLL